MQWNNDGDLVITDERVVMRPVGWLGQTGRFYTRDEDWKQTEPGGVSPIYIQISPE